MKSKSREEYWSEVHEKLKKLYPNLKFITVGTPITSDNKNE